MDRSGGPAAEQFLDYLDATLHARDESRTHELGGFSGGIHPGAEPMDFPAVFAAHGGDSVEGCFATFVQENTDSVTLRVSQFYQWLSRDNFNSWKRGLGW